MPKKTYRKRKPAQRKSSKKLMLQKKKRQFTSKQLATYVQNVLESRAVEEQE